MSDDDWTTVGTKKQAIPKNERNQVVTQNWEPVTLKNTKKPVENTKKNNVSYQESVNRKLENNDVTGVKIKCLSPEARQDMVKGRVAKKMNQERMAQALSIQVNLYKDIENGKVIPNPDLLIKISNLIGIKIKLSS
jgi:ribosome-binding protein aMBF1 (putative translation factor)